MRIGSLTMACVLLLASTGAEPEAWHLKSPRMKIPITLDPAQRNDLTEIILWYSTDQGKNWSQGPVAKPEQTEFPFTAPGDGQRPPATVSGPGATSIMSPSASTTPRRQPRFTQRLVLRLD